MLASGKAIRFRERSELLDFLLEVAAVTSQTLDLDELLASVSEIVKRVVPGELRVCAATAGRTREPVLAGDVRNAPRYLNSVEAVRSEMAVPMIARRRL